MNRSRRNVLKHYDLGNDFYGLWLDKSMTYSSALFEGDTTRSLEDAQAAKYARIPNKLALPQGAHILEIGCGWGGFAEGAARRGYRVTAITLSDAQRDYVAERIRGQQLDQMVDIRAVDYRRVDGTYDAVVSIGMFEHVGERYWREYFQVIAARLRPGGRAMVQSITLDDATFERLKGKRGFVEEVIFPGGMLPSKTRFRNAAGRAGLHCHEMHPFGPDYALTLRHWLDRFEAQKQRVREMGYDEAFIRLWRFYLSACIASFESGRSDVVQAALTHA